MQFKDWQIKGFTLFALVALLATYTVLRITHNEIPKFVQDPLVIGGLLIVASLEKLAKKSTDDVPPVIGSSTSPPATPGPISPSGTNATNIIVPFVIVLVISRFIQACSGSSAPPATVIDVGSYTADQVACVEREDSEKCHADKPACRERIDACRAEVKKRYGR